MCVFAVCRTIRSFWSYTRVQEVPKCACVESGARGQPRERATEVPGALGLKTKLRGWVQLAARWETWERNGGFMSSVGRWQSGRLHQKQGTKLKWRLRDRQEFSAHWSYIDTSTCMHTCIGRQTRMRTHTHRHQMTGWWNRATGSAKCLTLCRVQVRKLCAFFGLVCLLPF